MEHQTKVDDLCTVCNQQANQGFHFGILSCRACKVYFEFILSRNYLGSAFFRRTIANNRKYKCYRVGRCKVDSKSMNCRSCRLAKCFKVGMRVELVQNRPKMDTIELDHQIYSDTNQTKLTDNPSTQLSIIDRMNHGLMDYNYQQKSLFTMLFPEKDPNMLHQVTFDENIRMERGCLNLILNSLDTYFDSFADLNPKLKMSVFRNFSYHFSMFFQNYQTMVTFKDPADWHFLLHHGQVLDCKQVDFFHRNDPNPQIAMRLVFL